MKNRIFSTLSLIILLLIAICSSAIAQQYAIAVGSSSLYQMELGTDGKITSTPIYNLGTSVAGRAAAIYNNKLVITETDGTASSLRVFSLTDGKITEEASVSLGTIKHPTSIAVTSNAVTSNGGIYVNDNSSLTANYAYLPSLSSSAQIATITGHTNLRDVAGCGPFGLAISLHDATYNDQSYLTSINNGTIKSTTSLESSSMYPRVPTGVAATDTKGYVISQSIGASENAALSVCTVDNLGNITPDQSYTLLGFTPTDIITFTKGTTPWLALLGRGSGGSLQLLASPTTSITGSSLAWQTNITLSSDGSVDYRFAGSENGDTLWYSHPNGGTVGVIDTSSWAFTLSTNVAGITGLVGFTSGMTPVVPEPSSLASLAAFGLGAIGVFKRRKRA